MTLDSVILTLVLFISLALAFISYRVRVYVEQLKTRITNLEERAKKLESWHGR